MTAVSFETFPPKSLDASFHLWDTVRALSPLAPRFVSVTYGAGGSTQRLTQEAAQTLRKSSGLRVAAHLTCTGQSREEVLDTAQRYRAAGITDIVALRRRAGRHIRGGAGRVRKLSRTGSRAGRNRGFQDPRGGLSRRPSRRRIDPSEHRLAQGQGRRGRVRGDHPVLL